MVLGKADSEIGEDHIHPAGRAQTSDCSLNIFIMAVYEEKKLVMVWAKLSELRMHSVGCVPPTH